MLKPKDSIPPRYFVDFFRWFCHPSLKNSIEGDLMELYRERLVKFGKRKADQKFVIDVLLLFTPGIVRPSEGYKEINNYGMFKNYFKVGIRNILKYKVFSFINVFGLAIAMSVCMLIILMLTDQNRYDAFHKKKARVYRIVSDYEGSRQPYATSPYPLASTLKSDYSIIEAATTLMPGVGGDVTYGQRIADMRGYFADPAFFNVFSFELEKGDARSALQHPNAIIISQELANQLFGDENPLGKTVEFADRKLPFPLEFAGHGSPAVSWGSFTITGVMDEAKYKSHLRFDVLVSSSSLPALYAAMKIEDLTNNWKYFYCAYTYVLLKENRNKKDLSDALNDLVARKYPDPQPEESTKGFKLAAQNLQDIQLGLAGNDTNTRLPLFGYYFLAFLATVIMISACLNYTNLSIARALTRAKEIGVRKVTGANRKNLLLQFLSESIITALLALVMAIVLLLFIAPAFKGLWVNQYLNFELPSTPFVYFVFLCFALGIGIIAGIYPAVYLSKYQPIQALKNLNSVKPGRLVMQFFHRGFVYQYIPVGGCCCRRQISSCNELDAEVINKVFIGLQHTNILVLSGTVCFP